MNIFFTSDLHLFHKKIIEFENRPFASIEDMTEKLIENWNKVVNKGDEVFILGDFSFGKPEETMDALKRLNGQKFLVEGNHDRVTPEIKKQFVWVKPYVKIKRKNKTMVLCHYPIHVWENQHWGTLHFYGHVHNDKARKTIKCDMVNSYNVGVDVNNFTPVLMEDAIILARQTENRVQPYIIKSSSSSNKS